MDNWFDLYADARELSGLCKCGWPLYDNPRWGCTKTRCCRSAEFSASEAAAIHKAIVREEQAQAGAERGE